MFIELLSTNLDLKRLQKELEAAKLSSKVLIVDEANYEIFEVERSKYASYRWIFYGSKEFIHSTILKESFQKNLWAVIVENQQAPFDWAVLKGKLLEDTAREQKLLHIEIKKHPPQKQEALAEIEALLKSYALSDRVRSHFLTITDELLMNALYDAPFSEEKGFIYDKTPRHMPLSLEHPVNLELVRIGNYLKVRVTDFYGSLNKTRTIYHLTRQFDKKGYEVDNSKAGAGLGLAQSFKKGANLSFVCIPKKRTTVEATFKIVGSYKDHLQEHKFVVLNFQDLLEESLEKGA